MHQRYALMPGRLVQNSNIVNTTTNYIRLHGIWQQSTNAIIKKRYQYYVTNAVPVQLPICKIDKISYEILFLKNDVK